MSPNGLTPQEAAHWADRAGLPLPAERHEAAVVTAAQIQATVAVLRELDFGETPLAHAFHAERAATDQPRTDRPRTDRPRTDEDGADAAV